MIAVRGLRYVLPDRREILGGIDFDLASGQFLAVLGENGAGKTALLDLLMGFRRRTAGTILVMGQDPETDPTCGWRSRASGSRRICRRARRLWAHVKGFVVFAAMWLPLWAAWIKLIGDPVSKRQFPWFWHLPSADVVFPAGLIVLAFWLRHNARRWCVTL